jgi:hypothetical protein
MMASLYLEDWSLTLFSLEVAALDSTALLLLSAEQRAGSSLFAHDSLHI